MSTSQPSEDPDWMNEWRPAKRNKRTTPTKNKDSGQKSQLGNMPAPAAQRLVDLLYLDATPDPQTGVLVPPPRLVLDDQSTFMEYMPLLLQLDKDFCRNTYHYFIRNAFWTGTLDLSESVHNPQMPVTKSLARFLPGERKDFRNIKFEIVLTNMNFTLNGLSVVAALFGEMLPREEATIKEENKLSVRNDTGLIIKHQPNHYPGMVFTSATGGGLGRELGYELRRFGSKAIKEKVIPGGTFVFNHLQEFVTEQFLKRHEVWEFSLKYVLQNVLIARYGWVPTAALLIEYEQTPKTTEEYAKDKSNWDLASVEMRFYNEPHNRVALQSWIDQLRLLPGN